jgi:parvulin-like peptidyl-prolyl isomerase
LQGVGRLLYRAFLLSVCFVAIGQAQAQPGSDTGKPAENASSASTTTTGTANNDKVILKIGDLQITERAFEQYVSDLESTQGPADLSRKGLADNYSQLLMLSQQAKANKLQDDPLVQRQMAIDRMQILSNAEFGKLKQQAQPTPQQIKAYYDAHLEDYDVVKIRRVFIMGNPNATTPGNLTPEQAKALADKVKQAIASKQDVFPILKSTPHGTTDVVADTEPLTFQRGELPPQMDKTAFGLKEGQWTQLADGPTEFVFIQLVKNSRKDLNDVSPLIQKKLEADNLRDELKALKEKTGIWMDEEYFASKAPVPTSSTQPDASGQGKSGAERGEK